MLSYKLPIYDKLTIKTMISSYFSRSQYLVAVQLCTRSSSRTYFQQQQNYLLPTTRTLVESTSIVTSTTSSYSRPREYNITAACAVCWMWIFLFLYFCLRSERLRADDFLYFRRSVCAPANIVPDGTRTCRRRIFPFLLYLY